MGSSRIQFLEMVHQIDLCAADAQPRCSGRPSPRLPGRKLILTNGTRAHAEACIVTSSSKSVSISRISSTSRRPNSSRSRGPQVYERFLARHNVDAKRAAIFEDLARNLEVPHALGMITALVVPQGAGVLLREDWELAGRDEPHVDYVTDDLAGFLRSITAKAA